MPLYQKQPFVPNPIPENLKPDDLVFYHKLTNEIFTSHEEYFERSILCSSMVWSCAVTGKRSLTFQEALDSETRIRKPRGSKKQGPKDSNAPTTKKKKSTQKKSENSNASDSNSVTQNGSRKRKRQSNGSSNDESSSTALEQEEKRCKYDPLKFVHVPLPEDFDPELLTKTGKVDGRKLKNKKNAQVAQDLLDKKQRELELNPQLAEKPPRKKPGPKPGSKRRKRNPDGTFADESDDGCESKKSSKKSKGESKSLAKATKIEAKLKAKTEQDLIVNQLKAAQRERDAKRKKEAISLARQRERQRREDEKKEMALFLQEWDKKCEDLDRDDLRSLPEPIPIDFDIPPELFGDAIYIMEFLNNFHDVFNFRISSTKNFDLDVLEEILLDRSEESALSELLIFLLRTILDLQHTGDGLGDDGENAKKSTDDDESTIDGDAEEEIIAEVQDQGQDGEKDVIQAAIKQAQNVHNSLSVKLDEVEITPYNLTEILRLHLMQSGIFPRTRSVYNGWYSAREDPGLWLCIEEPQLIEKLSKTPVFDLSMQERIKIFHALIGQLLNFVTTRAYIEQANERLTELRREYRAHISAFTRWDKDNQVKRIAPPKTITLQMNASKKINPDNIDNADNEKTQEGLEKMDEHTQSLPNGTDVESSGEESQELVIKKRGPGRPPYKNMKPNESSQSQNALNGHDTNIINEEMDKEEEERLYQENFIAHENYQNERTKKLKELNNEILTLKTNIRNVQSLYGIHPIGRDRAYRRFWLFQSLPGIFVEADDSSVGRCLHEPTPLESRFRTRFNRDNPIQLEELEKLNENLTNSKKDLDTKDKLTNNSHKDHSDDVKKDIEDIKTEKDEKKPNSNCDSERSKPVLNGVFCSTDPKESNLDTKSVKENGVITNDASGNGDAVIDRKSYDVNAIADLRSEKQLPVHDDQIINRCLANEDDCFIHGKRRTEWQPKWAFYHTPEAVDKLIKSLNKRGIRESDLLETLNSERETIVEWVSKCPAMKLNKQLAEQSGLRRSRRSRHIVKRRTRFTNPGAYQNF